jgi:hypothetical protein
LYAWEKVRHCPEVSLVEGLFDYAVLRQAGFHNVACSLGTHLNADQFRQLITGLRMATEKGSMAKWLGQSQFMNETETPRGGPPRRP